MTRLSSLRSEGTMPNHHNILLIGASVRAAAHSAWRAGWRNVRCFDLFADRDLTRLFAARSVPMADYPKGLLAAIGRGERGPTIYTGALENRPDLLARLPQPVWGCPPDLVRRLRNPRIWHAVLREAGLPCPDARFTPPLEPDVPWLVKPIRSGGGLGIHLWRGEAINPLTHFLQQHLNGEPCAATFLGCDAGAVLLGTTRQLVGVPWLHAEPFGYAGSIGPLHLDAVSLEAWSRLGDAIAQHFRPIGLFGVDALIREGVPWPVEINPRYTASVEVLERSFETSFLRLHRDACLDFRPRRPSLQPGSIWGKAVIYAQRKLCFPEDGPWMAALHGEFEVDRAEFADIPAAGAHIGVGEPILTVFAAAADLITCEHLLREKCASVERCLYLS